MKTLLILWFILVASLVHAGESAVPMAPAATVVKGEVLEVKDVDGYTYLRLKTKDGETWAAVSQAPVKTGAEVTIGNAMVMHDFESKALKRTFKQILFGNLVGAGSTAGMGSAHGGVAKAPDLGDINVPKATGANARTVAEIITKRVELKDKPAVVRGKVVKYNAGIMGKNWVHLRDGTGSAADDSNDLLVTTLSSATVGDVVTAKGVVRADKDFGAGYSYRVLIEEATLQK